MTRGGRRPSSSDELLRHANEVASGAAIDIDGFSPQSPADSYEIQGLGTQSDASSTSATSDDRPLTAEEIAEELVAVAAENAPPDPLRPLEHPDGEAVGSPEVAGASSLPEWAVGSASAAPKAYAEASVSSMTERLRQLSRAPGDAAANSEDHEVPPGDAWREVPDLPPVAGDRWSTSTQDWESRPKPTPRRQIQVPRARTFISIAALAVFGLGFVVSALDGLEPVQDLAIGDCFTVGETEEINDVAVVDCSEAHDSELFARVTITDFGRAYPSDDALFEWLFDECLGEFPGYVGEPYETSNYWIDMFIPTEASWGDGDRIGLCTAIVVDEDLNIQTSWGSAGQQGTNA
jgi:hypothetical protein